MQRWVMNPDMVSMTLYEDGKPKAIIEQRMGIDLTTKKYHMVPNKFHVLFYKDYFKGVGVEYDENERIFIPRSFEYDTVEDAVKSVEKFIDYTFPFNDGTLMSDQIVEFIKESYSRDDSSSSECG